MAKLLWREWIKQEDPQQIKIYDTEQEWALVQAYINWKKVMHAEFTRKPYKVSRKHLKSFISKTDAGKEFAKTNNLNVADINHSFFIFPNQKSDNFTISALARSKSYTYRGKEYREGILGYGSVGRANPCRVKDSSKLLEPGKIMVIKTISFLPFLYMITEFDAKVASAKPEVLIMQALGREAALLVQRRGIHSADFWTESSSSGEYKTHILQDLAEGEDLQEIIKFKINSWTSRDKLKIALALAQEIKLLHDKGIIHRDIKPSNFRLLTEGSIGSDLDQNFVGTLVDFGIAVQLKEGENQFEDSYAGTEHFMAPEITEQGGFYSLAIDIYALGVLFEDLGLDKELYEPMKSKNPADRPTIDDIIHTIEPIFKYGVKNIGPQDENAGENATQTLNAAKDKESAFITEALDALRKASPETILTARNWDGDTLLTLAALRSNPEIIAEILVKIPEDKILEFIDKRDYQDKNALLIAAENGSTACIEAIMDKIPEGELLRFIDKSGRNSLLNVKDADVKNLLESKLNHLESKRTTRPNL